MRVSHALGNTVDKEKRNRRKLSGLSHVFQVSISPLHRFASTLSDKMSKNIRIMTQLSTMTVKWRFNLDNFKWKVPRQLKLHKYGWTCCSDSPGLVVGYPQQRRFQDPLFCAAGSTATFFMAHGQESLHRSSTCKPHLLNGQTMSAGLFFLTSLSLSLFLLRLLLLLLLMSRRHGLAVCLM